MSLDDLAKINRAWQYKDLKMINLTSNAKLAQSERHKSVTQEAPAA